MSIENLTKHAFIVQTNCPMWPNHCVMVEHPLGEYIKFEEARSSFNMLKAEIATILNRGKYELRGGIAIIEFNRSDIEQLLQLSS